MVDFKSIETFLWVVTLGSFRGAGQRLNTTQPAISQRIAQLEREMGVKLLNRDHRVVSPTPSGRQLMLYAEKLIGLRAEMMAEVGDRSAMRGVLRLGVAETIVHTWLSQLIKSVNTAYPNLSLEIEVDITPNLTARLMAQEIELALLLGPLPLPASAIACSATIRSGSSPALRSVLPPGPLKAKDLAKFPIITFPRKTQPYEIVRSLFNRPGPAADPAARQRLARDRDPYGARRARHCRHPDLDRRKRTGGRTASAAFDRPQDHAVDVFGKLAGIARYARGRTCRRPCCQNCARQRCNRRYV